MGCLMKVSAFALLVLAGACTKTECINADGCDTAEPEAGPTGPVTVQFEWVNAAAFEVTVTGISSAKLGIAETGLGGTGYYLEDCVGAGAKCHPLTEGTNTFISQHENATGVPWDGVLDDGETFLHQDAEEHLTYAVWSMNDDCLAVAGQDVGYYATHGCVNLGD